MAKKNTQESVAGILSLDSSIETLLGAIPEDKKAYTPKLSEDKMKVLVQLTDAGRSSSAIFAAFPELAETYKSHKGLAIGIANFKRGGHPSRGKKRGSRVVISSST